jgi:hypothetical protein
MQRGQSRKTEQTRHNKKNTESRPEKSIEKEKQNQSKNKAKKKTQSNMQRARKKKGNIHTNKDCPYHCFIPATRKTKEDSTIDIHSEPTSSLLILLSSQIY